MRLLVTNTRCAQAYAIIRALRPFADKIVATLSGSRPLGLWPTCHAAYSRLVDRRYQVPDPERDWLEGRIQPDNTEREQAFVDAVLRICASEGIDTIFPSNDPWVYVFAKNKELFAERGVLIPIPDYATVTTPLDKYKTIQFAQEVGFPCPRTYLAEDDEDVAQVARELAPPWVIKLRFTTGGRGQLIVDQRSKLLEHARAIRRHHGAPVIQEYVPGKGYHSCYLVLDREGQLLSAFTPRILRYSGRLFRVGLAACESAAPHPLVDRAVRLVRRMGWWGGTNVQTRLDSRDGEHRLMEVNPRLGSGLWYRTELGINEPLMCLKIARGDTVDDAADYPLGCLLLKPIEDAADLAFGLLDLAAYCFRTAILRRAPLDPSNPPMALRELAAAYREQYLSDRDRRFSPHFRYALEDPLPTLIWCSKVLATSASGVTKGLGR